MSFLDRIKNLFLLDVRSLGLFRIAFGLLLLIDLGIRAEGLVEHYTDAGVLPRGAFESVVGPSPGTWSLLDLTGSTAGVTIFFILAGLAATGLLLGWRTRLMTFLCWIFWLSLHTRNDLVLDGSDNMLRVFLFWGMFLPLGNAFSLDGRRKSGPLPDQVFSGASFAFVIQFILIYFYTAVWKSGPEWHSEGSALYMALSIDIYTRPFGQWMLTWPQGLLKFLTISVLWFEFIGPFLVLIPWKNDQFRCIVICLFSLFQLMLAFTFCLGLFPFVSIAIMLAFIPRSSWENGLMKRIFGRWKPDKKLESRARRSIKALNITIVGLVVFMILMNISTLRNPPFSLGKAHIFARAIGMEQKWSMFGPFPDTDDGWFVIEANLENGETVDLMPFLMGKPESNPPDWEKPEVVHKQFNTARWSGYMWLLWLYDYEYLRPYLADYLCRKWASEYPEKPAIREMVIWFMLEKTIPWETPEVQKSQMWRQNCKGEIL